MTKMPKFKFKIAALALALCCFWPATSNAQWQVVASCPASRSTPLTVGSQYLPTIDVNGNQCVSNAGSGGGSVTQGTTPWIVGGKDANGAAPTANPIWFAGWDGTDLRAIATDSTGHLVVNINSGQTVAVTGTFWPYTLGQQSFANSVPTVDAADFASTVSSAVTRVANTTTYTANTGWCTLTSSCITTFSWPNACRANGGNVLITNISIYSSANPSTKLQGILWLFNAAPGTIVSDDATFNIAAADFANLVGGSFNGIPFTLASSQASGAANSGVSLTGLNYQAACASGATTLYGMVQVVNAYAPASAEVLTVRLHTIGLN